MSTADVAVSRLAAQQHAHFSRQQVLDLGMPSRTLDRRVETGAYVDARLPAIYRLASAPVTWHGRLWAAQLWARHGTISHAAAAALWKLSHFEPGPVHITVPSGAKHEISGITVHQSRLGPSERRLMDGLAVTSPERTLADIAWGSPAWLIDDTAESAFYLGLTTPERVLEAIRGRPGSALLREILERRRDGRPRQSPLEGRFFRLMDAAGITGFVRQYEVRIDSVRYFLDAAIPDIKLAVELDGLGKRTNRAAAEAELRRQNCLILLGYTILRFTSDHFRNPDQVVADVLAAIEIARAAS